MTVGARVLCTLVFLGCGLAVVGPSAVGASAAARESVSVAGCAPGSIEPMRGADLSYAAVAVGPLRARRALNRRSGTPFAKRNVNGVPTVFGVLKVRRNRFCRPTHYLVQLPIRPNGATGWVRAVDVRLRTVRTRIEVDLSQRRITLFRDGRVTLVTTAAVGAPSTPTPTGRFYVNQRLMAANPLGGYGPGAVGISAFSPVLVNWPQGGPIAIHGTDAPALLGTAISHGCLRVHNGAAQRLLRLAVEGTPVVIKA